ncbi:MAG: hypothetical protein U0350_19920 [Caldilineaceae bacterium]
MATPSTLRSPNGVATQRVELRCTMASVLCVRLFKVAQVLLEVNLAVE